MTAARRWRDVCRKFTHHEPALDRRLLSPVSKLLAEHQSAPQQNPSPVSDCLGDSRKDSDPPQKRRGKNRRLRLHRSRSVDPILTLYAVSRVAAASASVNRITMLRACIDPLAVRPQLFDVEMRTVIHPRVIDIEANLKPWNGEVPVGPALIVALFGAKGVSHGDQAPEPGF